MTGLLKSTRFSEGQWSNVEERQKDNIKRPAQRMRQEDAGGREFEKEFADLDLPRKLAKHRTGLAGKEDRFFNSTHLEYQGATPACFQPASVPLWRDDGQGNQL